jgi:hypothetical protein
VVCERKSNPRPGRGGGEGGRGGKQETRVMISSGGQDGVLTLPSYISTAIVSTHPRVGGSLRSQKKSLGTFFSVATGRERERLGWRGSLTLTIYVAM